MTFKRMVFWAHLVAGVATGFVILTMSVTGVLLTYEHTIINKVEQNVDIAPINQTPPLSVDQLYAQILKDAPNVANITLQFRNNDNIPAMVSIPGHDKAMLDPYTGQTTRSPSASLEKFFHKTVEVHRWLALDGASRKTGQMITGLANLVFLFMIASGLYLWLPKILKWRFLRLNFFFRKNLPSSKARDYNWHHVFGIWALTPLFFIVISGVIISYSWANAGVYKTFGEEVPTRRGPPWMQFVNQPSDETIIQSASLQDIYDNAVQYNKNWASMKMIVPLSPKIHNVVILQNSEQGILPKQRTTLVFSLKNAELVTVQSHSDRSPGLRARMFIRFLHTGEIFGLIGQTIAGFASIATCFLVYTGLALSYRRLILPLVHRKKKGKS